MKDNLDTRVDIHEHKGLVFQSFNKRRIPQEVQNELFQEFSVYFYEKYYFKEGDKVAPYVKVSLHSFLTKRAKDWKKDKHNEDAVYIQEQHPNFLDNFYSEDDTSEWTPEEIRVYCEEIAKDMPEDVQEWLLSLAGAPEKRSYDGYLAQIAAQEGVTRQAVHKRLLNRLRKHLETKRD